MVSMINSKVTMFFPKTLITFTDIMTQIHSQRNARQWNVKAKTILRDKFYNFIYLFKFQYIHKGPPKLEVTFIACSSYQT